MYFATYVVNNPPYLIIRRPKARRRRRTSTPPRTWARRRRSGWGPWSGRTSGGSGATFARWGRLDSGIIMENGGKFKKFKSVVQACSLCMFISWFVPSQSSHSYSAVVRAVSMGWPGWMQCNKTGNGDYTIHTSSRILRFWKYRLNRLQWHPRDMPKPKSVTVTNCHSKHRGFLPLNSEFGSCPKCHYIWFVTVYD